MSAPPKPWETSRNNFRLQQQQSTSSFSSPVLTSSVFPRLAYTNDKMFTSNNSTPQSSVPRAPPRPPGSTLPPGTLGQSYGMSSYGYNSPTYSPYGMRSSYGYGGYGGYGGYSSYGMGGYGSYSSPYSSYGMMGYNRGGYSPYGQVPYGQAAESRFIRMAEENSRPAFESLESMVHAFGSVSMMLESTFYAIHSSFRAVLGVADNFGRMRGMLAQVFSALTIFRAVRWAYHKLLELLGLRKAGGSEKIWAEAKADSGLAAIIGGADQDARKSSAWPIVMFLSLVMGGPYLIWKLVRSVLSNIPDMDSPQDGSNEPWMQGKAPCMIGKATYSYHAASADELSFNVGDVIAMAPQDKQPYHSEGWLIGKKIGDAAGGVINGPSPIGLVPSNHFKTLYCKAKKPSAQTGMGNMPVINEDPQPSTSSAPDCNPTSYVAEEKLIEEQNELSDTSEPEVLNIPEESKTT